MSKQNQGDDEDQDKLIQQARRLLNGDAEFKRDNDYYPTDEVRADMTEHATWSSHARNKDKWANYEDTIRRSVIENPMQHNPNLGMVCAKFDDGTWTLLTGCVFGRSKRCVITSLHGLVKPNAEIIRLHFYQGLNGEHRLQLSRTGNMTVSKERFRDFKRNRRFIGITRSVD